MSKQESTETSKDQEGGLGFSRLSMNEIAPAVTAERSEEGKRASYTWLITIAILVVVVGGGWMIRSGFSGPPPKEVQDQVLQAISQTPFARDRVIVGATFPSGDTLRLEFTPTISTEDLGARTNMRSAAVAAMRALAAAIPRKDLSVVGYQGENKIVEARYSYQSAMVSSANPKASNELDISMWVQNGEGDGIGVTKSQESHPGSSAGISGGE